jgi:hypothetical protein
VDALGDALGRIDLFGADVDDAEQRVLGLQALVPFPREG